MFPKRSNQRGPTTHSAQRASSVVAQFPKIPRAQVWQLMVLQMTEDVLARIQFGRIRGKIFQLNTTVLALDKEFHQRTAMRRQSIPDHQQWSRNVSQEVTQKFDQLWSPDRPFEQTKVKVPPADSGDQRQYLPIEVVLQHRRLSFRRPSAAAVWPLAQSTFVDKDDRPPFDFGFFFSSGHRPLFQRRIAGSSRSKALPVGRWQLHPRSCRIRHACTVVYRTPHSCSIRSATRWLVHKAVSYPSASGPRCSPSTIRFRSSSLNLGLRPARPAFFNAGDPPSCFCLAHRTTDCRCTPTLRATSLWLTFWSSNLAAFIRRRSNAPKSRFTPAGFPMPATVTRFLQMCIYIM